MDIYYVESNALDATQIKLNKATKYFIEMKFGVFLCYLKFKGNAFFCVNIASLNNISHRRLFQFLDI